jgi:hypothetical protein
MGFEPMNTGFADQRVSHFATGASAPPRIARDGECHGALTAAALLFEDTASLFCIPERSCPLLRSRLRRR